MNIIYTDYAEDTLKDRKIDKNIIEDAIKNPDEVVEGKNKRKIAHKIIGNKLLRVIYETDKKAYIVITCYYTKPERYLK